MSRGRNGFHPRQVPEIRNGYYWLVKDQVGLGTTSFKVPEGNKHSSFDLIQSTVVSQPTALTENNGQQFRMRRSADSNPSKHVTSGNVSAGFTGKSYVSGWFRLPDASGDITGAGSLFSHNTSAGNQRRIAITLTSTTADGILTTLSSLGSNASTHKWVNPFVGNWTYIENLIIPGVSIELYADMVLVSVITPAVPGTPFFDALAPLGIANSALGATNVDTTDWATCYYGNGIPTPKNRKRLANYLNPSNVKFQL